jgi:hypothetical protein
MVTIAAASAAAVLLALAAIHVYWAAGGTAGAAAAVPARTTSDARPAFIPGPASTLVVAVLLVLAACAIALTGLHIAHGATGIAARIASALVALAFAARAVGEFRYVGIGKRVRGTEFARRDTFIYTPLCAALACACAATAVAA